MLIFTDAYIVVFGSAFLAAGNGEFVWYVPTLPIFLGLIAATQRVAQFPALIRWGLVLWGLAGGGYFNTALDLVFNTLGALAAAVLASLLTPAADKSAGRSERQSQ